MLELSPVDVVLTLADLERHDPHPQTGSDEQRFLCPLDGCRDHTDPRRHRSLTANVYTGLWWCHRCGSGGMLREFWKDGARAQSYHPPRAAKTAAPATPRPEVTRTEKVGAVRRWRCQDATGAVRGVQCRQDVRVTRADGTTEPDKQPWWELPDGRRSQGQVQSADLVYCTTALPEIPDGADVLVVEGPPKADAGTRLGRRYVVALVCGAASTPSEAILDQLARWRCTLSPDHDASGTGQGLMRRIAAALLERGSAPRWLTLPVGDKGDLVDFERDGGTAEDLATRIATAPAAYIEVVAALKAEFATGAAGEAGAAEQADLKADHRALLAENAALKAQVPEAFAARVARGTMQWETDTTTRGKLAVYTQLWVEQAHDERPIDWCNKTRAQQFGWGTNDDRMGQVIRHGVARGVLYRTERPRGRHDYNVKQQVALAPDLRHLDLPDYLTLVQHRLKEQPKPRQGPAYKQKAPCTCNADVCPTDPTHALTPTVARTCETCAIEVTAPHDHAPTRPVQRQVLPAVSHRRVPSVALHLVGSDPENLDQPTKTTYVPENLDHSPASAGDVLTAALDIAQRLAVDLDVDHLPAAQAVTLKGELLGYVARLLRAGQPVPPVADLAETCVRCGQPLAPSEMVVHAQCPAAEGVA